MRVFKSLVLAAVIAALPLTMVACSSDDDDNNSGSGGTTSGTGGKANGGESGKGGGTSGGGNAGGAGKGGGTGSCDLSGEGKEIVDIEASIAGPVTLTSDTVWRLNGMVEVVDGGVLTIEPCTRIIGTKDPVGVLMVERGGKLIADGTADEPILFTSDQPAGSRVAGDWGGVVLLGKAQIAGGGEAGFEGQADNPAFRYGGTDDADSSGSIQFVRIEFGGYEFLADKEINGLSMAGVGSGTTIQNVMVSNTSDDCFEWWGGTVSANNLVCNNPGDDMFDTDEGYRATNKNWFGRLTSSALATSDNPNGFEWDSIKDGSMPVTNVTVSNVTLCGAGEGDFAAEPHYGAVLRELITGSISNMVLAGFEYGVDARDNFLTAASAPRVTLAESEFIGTPAANPADDDAKDAAFDESAWFATTGWNNVAAATGSLTLEDCNAADGPAAAVTGSQKGAFTESATWASGAWIDWSAN